MTCVVDRRQRARSAAESVGADPSVEFVDVVEPDADPTGQWTIEITTVVDVDGIPPRVLRAIADAGLGLRHAGPRGDRWHAVATLAEGSR